MIVQEATLQVEMEIAEDKLKQGINGLEWLVMQVVVDDERKESLGRWMKFAPITTKKKSRFTYFVFRCSSFRRRRISKHIRT